MVPAGHPEELFVQRNSSVEAASPRMKVWVHSTFHTPWGSGLLVSVTSKAAVPLELEDPVLSTPDGKPLAVTLSGSMPVIALVRL